jgi:hypothetical protein
MQIARPAGGFRIVVRPAVQQYIATEIAENFRIEQYWKDILERLKITALQESHPLTSPSGIPTFSFVANGAVDFNIPTIQIVFECLADTLEITGALVWTEQDYEDSSY